MESAPKRYPATEENTTLTESRSLVISVKLPIKDGVIDFVLVTDKFFFLNGAKIHLLYFLRNI